MSLRFIVWAGLSLFLFRQTAGARSAFHVFMEADTIPLSSHRLLSLKTPDERVRKYVNFDVLKLMLGTGFVVNHPGRERFGMPFRAQLLYPYSINRTRKIPFAVGLTAGVNRFSLRKVSFEFTGNDLTAINENPAIKRSIHRNSYSGLIVLGIIRPNKLRWLTLMAGPSLEVNSAGTIKEIREGQAYQVYRNTHTLKRFSAPLHIQLSISKKQFFSVGGWTSIPTSSLFRGKNYKNLRQYQFGLSGAIIL